MAYRDRNYTSGSARTSSSGSPRRPGFHGSLTPNSMLYPSLNEGSSGYRNITSNFDNFDNPMRTSRHNVYGSGYNPITSPPVRDNPTFSSRHSVYGSGYRSSTPPPIRDNSMRTSRHNVYGSGYRSITPPPTWGNISQPPSGYDIRHSVSRRSRELSPRRNDNIMYSNSSNTPTRSLAPVDRGLFRSSTLPRHHSHGNTNSSFYAHRDLTPTRSNNRTDISTYSDIIGSPLTGMARINRNNRRNRSLPSRTTAPTSRYNRNNPNVVNLVHTVNRTVPGSMHFESGMHYPNTTADYNTREPVHYYTYSDDEKEERDFKPTSFSSNADSSGVTVKEIDCLVTQNARDHHTERFAKSSDKFLIVRRAQPFQVSVYLNTRFSKSEHDVCVEFSTGPAPQPGKGTYIKLSTASPILSADAWIMKLESVVDNKVTLSIETIPTAIVGEWKMVASVTHKDKQDGSSHLRKGVSFYLLFNPWSRDDDVYFPDKSKLSEYILNDSGCIFTGGHNQIAAKPWFYGQFESGILEAAIHCLKKAFDKRPRRSMGDPVRLSRAISKIVNSNDDNGVVWGSWSGNYRDGTAPLAWVGSVSILRQFMMTGKPAKYGQCFVFAGVVTTICRALGIPCRTVTNFSSAHDTDGSVTVDVHWDRSSSSELSTVNSDSIWNFHVWNDVWMKRKDLPAGNDGWQVLDSTPQETSDGEFRCGPAPLTAILNGKCDVNYDTAFIYAEVNADRIHWGQQDDGSWQIIGIDQSVVGKMISTKKADGLPLPDNFDDCEKFRDDITHQYKYIEGSDRERMSVMTATRTASGGYSRIYTKDNDLKINILPPKSVLVGSDFDVVVEISNSAGVSKSLSGRMLCEVTKYTGAVVHMCKDEVLNIEIEAYQQQKLVMHVTVDDYVDAVAEAAMFRFAMISRVKESGHQFAALETFRLRLPDLTIKVRDKFLRAGVPVEVTVGFRNPLKSRSLTNCLILAECPGVEDIVLYKTRDVMPDEQFQTTIQLTPLARGTCPVFMTFNCDQIHDIKGTCGLFVQ